jgi:predicted nuclease of restriction endonuclease-like (RecB) superfamily
MDKNELIDWESTYQKIADVLTQARHAVWQATNAAMVATYWEIGKIIVEKEQEGQKKAKYGESLIKNLSQRLSQEFGKGFEYSNLTRMRNFYLTYPKLDAVRQELSWTHYRLLLKVERSEARAFYEKEAIQARWSTRELERQINSLLFERLALSQDKAGVLELAQKGHEINHPTDLVKDPYVLEFVGMRQDARLFRVGLRTGTDHEATGLSSRARKRIFICWETTTHYA